MIRIPWLFVEARMPVHKTKEPGAQSARPPILMVHGACSSSWVWSAWQEALAAEGWASYALALRGHRGGPSVDLATVTMKDYVDDVVAVARHLPQPPVIMGWSMGGLAALMYAARDDVTCPGLIALAPSTTAETQETATPESLAAIPDVFGPDYYGIRDSVAASRRAMPELTDEEISQVIALMGPESGRARRERKAGVAIPAEAIRCPVLVLAGERDSQFPPPVCQHVADYYRGRLLEVPGAGHMGLVRSSAIVARTAPKVIEWLRTQVRHATATRQGVKEKKR